MSACAYGDPLCPCQDGDPCHYEGRNPMTPANGFDLDAWLDAHDDAPAREELEPGYSSDEAA